MYIETGLFYILIVLAMVYLSDNSNVLLRALHNVMSQVITNDHALLIEVVVVIVFAIIFKLNTGICNCVKSKFRRNNEKK